MNKEEYQEMLERGRRDLDARLAEAKKRNIRTMNCNGKENCTSEHHLCICPKREKT